MKYIDRNGFIIPRIVMGCAGFGGIEPTRAAAAIEAALKQGANFFDHADIYGRGKSEEVFAEGVKLAGVKREDMIIQSKTGIRFTYYDFSTQHILNAVEESLKRLNTEYLDALVMHRPDALMEPEEVAAAFDKLYESGKVRHFGVSNHTPMQMELLKTCVRQPLEFSQMQFSLTQAGMVEQGVVVNMPDHGSADRAGEILNYARLNNVTIQTWSPLKYDSPRGYRGAFIGSPEYPELNKRLTQIAGEYGVTEQTIAIAWILRHPAKMQAIIGTKTPDRIEALCKAVDIELTRPQWYDLYTSEHKLP